eukprot:284815896_6
MNFRATLSGAPTFVKWHRSIHRRTLLHQLVNRSYNDWLEDGTGPEGTQNSGQIKQSLVSGRQRLSLLNQFRGTPCAESKTIRLTICGNKRLRVISENGCDNDIQGPGKFLSSQSVPLGTDVASRGSGVQSGSCPKGCVSHPSQKAGASFPFTAWLKLKRDLGQDFPENHQLLSCEYLSGATDSQQRLVEVKTANRWYRCLLGQWCKKSSGVLVVLIGYMGQGFSGFCRRSENVEKSVLMQLEDSA